MIRKKRAAKGGLVMSLMLAASLVLSACGGSGDDLSASTMRLLRTEGDVTLEADGTETEFMENQRLADGNAVRTGSSALASIGLDDTKIVTMDEKSRTEFYKDGKALSINVTDGSIFFEVSQKLADDETFDIETSTMVVGIRGTSGYVTADDEGHASIYLTDGNVEIEVINPVTGATETRTLAAGNKATVYVYGDTVEFIEVPLSESQLPGFVIERLSENDELLGRVTAATGWSESAIAQINEQVAAGSYEPETSSPIMLGLADADDLALDGGYYAIESVEDDDSADVASEQSADADSDEADDEAETTATGNTTAAGGNTTANAAANRVAATAANRTTGTAVTATDANGVMMLADGTVFDPAYYAAMNPDVVAVYGNDPAALLSHYITFGRNENRATTGTIEAAAPATAPTYTAPVTVTTTPATDTPAAATDASDAASTDTGATTPAASSTTPSTPSTSGGSTGGSSGSTGGSSGTSERIEKVDIDENTMKAVVIGDTVSRSMSIPDDNTQTVSYTVPIKINGKTMEYVSAGLAYYNGIYVTYTEAMSSPESGYDVSGVSNVTGTPTSAYFYVKWIDGIPKSVVRDDKGTTDIVNVNATTETVVDDEGNEELYLQEVNVTIEGIRAEYTDGEWATSPASAG